MDNFRSKLFNFMQGRYGYDELGRSMSIWVIILIVASIVVGIVARLIYNFGGSITVASGLGMFSTVLNWLSIIVLIITFWRMLSRKHDKRRKENERFLGWKSKGQQKRDLARDQKDYTYLNCGFCGQKMRVPKGKGKIAAKCPACGEKTIVNS